MPDSPDLSVSRDEMLAIRNATRAHLRARYHSHLLIASLYKRFNNPTRAAVESAEAEIVHAMLAALEDEPDTAHGTSIRLT